MKSLEAKVPKPEFSKLFSNINKIAEAAGWYVNMFLPPF